MKKYLQPDKATLIIAGAPPAKKRLELYQNASLLELGVSELGNIRVESVP